MNKIPQDLLSLAGEYRVCSELNKRGIFATVTYGNRKAVDVYAISDKEHRALKIEVKTSQQGNFVTRISQKKLADDPKAPDFWVLYQIKRRSEHDFVDRFFVLNHREICEVQATVNQEYAKQYIARHGREPDLSTGVDNVRVADVEKYENQWSKIAERLEK
jgi:hypothetical protein